MTYLVERLAELRRHLDHLRKIGPRVTNRIAIERDLSLHNDVMFSLLMVAQLVVDVAGEYLVQELERVAGFRNVVFHEYVALDLDRVVEALRRLDPIERFIAIVRDIEAAE